MPEPMTEGMNLDPTTLIAVMNERLASAAIREAQLTAAVQQLTMQVMSLEEQLNPVQGPMHEGKAVTVVEDEDASADDTG